MSERIYPTFVAVIQIMLPGEVDKVTANVTLTPSDAIPANGRYKQLRDCTLADLQAFANELEAEVWETYREIRLVDLANNEAAGVMLTILDESGAPVPADETSLQNAVVLLSPDDEKAANEAPAYVPEKMERQPEPKLEAVSEAPASPESTLETAVASQPENPETAAMLDEGEPETAIIPDEIEIETAVTPQEELPEITVAESEPVFEEPEAEEGVATRIEPSQARVRVAGRLLPVGHPTWAAVDILIEEPALRGAQAHALSSLDREVAGVLVGPRPEKQPDGRYVVRVVDTIVAKHTVTQGASVTYTPESWRYVNDTLLERYPDETAVIVGWYHTHPGFGIFLSGMDQFIHQNFFTQIWHVALVLDPRARTSGFFCWDREKRRVAPYEFAWPAWAAGAW